MQKYGKSLWWLYCIWFSQNNVIIVIVEGKEGYCCLPLSVIIKLLFNSLQESAISIIVYVLRAQQAQQQQVGGFKIKI